MEEAVSVAEKKEEAWWIGVWSVRVETSSLAGRDHISGEGQRLSAVSLFYGAQREGSFI